MTTIQQFLIQQFSAIGAVNGDIKSKKKKNKIADNHGHDISRLFDGWTNFPVNTGET